MNHDGDIRILDLRSHIRLRPAMYIANTGGGKTIDDGVYSLVREVVENATDEFNAGFGTRLEIKCEKDRFAVRDFGRGIPLESLRCVCETPNSGGKFSDAVYRYAAGLHGLGLKVVRNLCSVFRIRSIRSGKFRELEYLDGELKNDLAGDTTEPNGTCIEAHPDPLIFSPTELDPEIVNDIALRYLGANPGLEIVLNSRKLPRMNGVAEYLARRIDPLRIGVLVSVRCKTVELAFAQHRFAPGWWCSFANGHCTGNGGVHADAAKAALAASARAWWRDGCGGKTLNSRDVLHGICGVVSVRVKNPRFEGQTKNRMVNPEEFKSWRDGLTQELNTYWCNHPEECENFFQQIDHNIESRKRQEKIQQDEQKMP